MSHYMARIRGIASDFYRVAMTFWKTSTISPTNFYFCTFQHKDKIQKFTLQCLFMFLYKLRHTPGNSPVLTLIISIKQFLKFFFFEKKKSAKKNTYLDPWTVGPTCSLIATLLSWWPTSELRAAQLWNSSFGHVCVRIANLGITSFPTFLLK